MQNLSQKQRHRGYTLIEIMVAVAIIAIISAIAVPAYQGYIREARFSTAHMNASTLRVFLEDYRLDNGTYIAGGSPPYDKSELETLFGWSPDGDRGAFTYEVAVTAGTWDIVVTHIKGGEWIRCEDGMGKCCDSDTPSASKAACP